MSVHFCTFKVKQGNNKMTQEALEQAVKSKIAGGYLSIDSKNIIVWAALSSLLLSTAMVSYQFGYNQSQKTCEFNQILVEGRPHKHF